MPSLGASSLLPHTLPTLIWSVADKVWPTQSVTFVEGFPRGKVTGPTIAWHVWRRLPGREGLGRHKPQLRRTRTNLVDLTEEQIYAQWQTVWYQFDCYDVGDDAVNKLAFDLENLLYAITGFLQKAGVDEFLFDEEFEDTLLSTKQDVYVRSLRYLCILERRYTRAVPLIQQIILRVLAGTVESLNTPVMRATEGLQDRLPLNWASALYRVTKDAVPTGGERTPDSDYLFGLDYTLDTGQNGESYLNWIAGRAAPEPGSTYYVSYAAFENTPDLPL